MATTSEDILQQLLSLPVETRVELAEKLLESLEPPDETNRRLWAAEAERRVEAYDRGEIQAVPGQEVFERLRKKFPK